MPSRFRQNTFYHSYAKNVSCRKLEQTITAPNGRTLYHAYHLSIPYARPGTNNIHQGVNTYDPPICVSVACCSPRQREFVGMLNSMTLEY